MIEAKWFRFLWKKESQKCVLRWISRISNQTREFFIFKFHLKYGMSQRTLSFHFFSKWDWIFIGFIEITSKHVHRRKFRSSELTECSAGYISYDEKIQYVPKIVEISFTWISNDCNLCSAKLDLHMEKEHEWKL